MENTIIEKEIEKEIEYYLKHSCYPKTMQEEIRIKEILKEETIYHLKYIFNSILVSSKSNNFIEYVVTGYNPIPAIILRSKNYKVDQRPDYDGRHLILTIFW